jgi:hypothetical protein
MARRLLNSGLRATAHRPRRYSKPSQEPQGSGDTNPSADPPAEPTGEPADAQVVVPDDVTKVADIEQWVGDDPAKAQAVLDREQAAAYVRPTVVKAMTAVVEQHDLI